MWLERLILKKVERSLSPYRQVIESLDSDFLEQYQASLPEIERVNSKASHWHGTGRYQYSVRQTKQSASEVVDVLGSVLSNDGLTPRHDPWIDSGTDTVSLATVRMHGRIYARVHMQEGASMQYELGSVVLWSRLYFTLLFVWLIANFWQHRGFIRKLFRPSSVRSIQHRVGTTRKPRNQRKVSLLEFIQGKHLSSDIEGNYPILFGVSPAAQDLIETIPLTHKVEQRSVTPITLDMFTHIEVPLEKVPETEALLQKHQITLPVVAIEFGDVYLSEIPLRELAFS